MIEQYRLKNVGIATAKVVRTWQNSQTQSQQVFHF